MAINQILYGIEQCGDFLDFIKDDERRRVAALGRQCFDLATEQTRRLLVTQPDIRLHQ